VSLWDLAEAVTGRKKEEIIGEVRRRAGEYLAKVTPKCERCGCLLLYHTAGVGPCNAHVEIDGPGPAAQPIKRKCHCPGFVGSPRDGKATTNPT
jgi:hypothetical protein